MRDYSDKTKKEILDMKVVDTGCGKLASIVLLEQEIEMLEELLNQLSERVCFLERNIV